MNALQEKKRKLEADLSGLGSVAVAFSAGVDSTFLLKMAHRVLGDRVLAVTVNSGLSPKRELKEAEAFCEREGITQTVIEIDALSIQGFRENPVNRCYICKRELFKKIQKAAAERGIPHVAEGSNVDDEGDYRPGMQAIAELGIKSPLREAGFTKEEIRKLSEEMGLPTWNKPSLACLASRFVYGETISREKLDMVGKAEQLLSDLGFHQVRVRIHGDLARIEVLPSEFEKLTEEQVRDRVSRTLKELGFSYVTMDLIGYRTGSMNETLE